MVNSARGRCWLVLVAAALFIAPAAVRAATPIRVLLIYDTLAGNTPALKSYLEANNCTVTYSSTAKPGYDGTNPSLSDFDAVILLNGTTYGEPMPAGGITALVNYVQAGGGYVGQEWNAFDIDDKNIDVGLTEITPLTRLGGREGPLTVSVIPTQASHPVLLGIPASFTFTAGCNVGGLRSYGANPAVALANDEVGSVAIATREYGSGKVVQFHHAGNYGDYSTLADGNVQRLYLNAIRWVGNNAPTIAGTLAGQQVNDNASLAPFSGVTISDSIVQALSVAVQLDDAAKGAFTTLNGFTDAGGGLYTFSGTAAEATAAIRGLVFTPTPRRVPRGSTETTTMTITAGDGIAPDVTDSTTTVVSTTVNRAPLATAGVSPANGAVQLAVAFTANGSDSDGDTLSYSWNFGDGSPVSAEQNPTHIYVAVGTYTATVTVSDGMGGTATASVTVTVVAAGGFMLGDTDSDGDGYYDEIEAALGSSPADYSSRPLGLATVTTNGNLYTVKTNIRLNFARTQGNDSITMTGVVFIPAGFSIAGKTAIVDVGGVVKAFTLDAKGASPQGNERFAVRVKAPAGVVPLQEAKFTLTMQKGTYAATLLNDGLLNDDVLKSVTVPETVIFNGEVLKKAAALIYRGQKGRMGMAR